MSPDMNPIEHVWDFIGRKINQRNPKCQNIDELRTAILQEWQRGSKQALEKRITSLSLMEVFNIALQCRVFRF
jgi:transposase